MLASLALSLSLLAPPAPSPMADCRANPIQDSGWSYDCGQDRRAQLADMERMSAETRDTLLHQDPGVEGSKAEQETRTLDGKKAVVVRRATATERYLVTILDRAEGSRMMTCYERAKSAWCDGALELLAAAPWRGGPAEGSTRAAARPLTLRGKPVTVPAWCQGKLLLEAGGQVSCRKPEMSWSRFAIWFPGPGDARGSELGGKFESFIDQTVRQLEESGTKLSAPEKIACRLAGQPTTCVRRRNEAVTVLSASATVGQEVLVAACLGDTPRLAEPPCSILFELQ